MTALRQDAEAAAGGLLALHKRDDEFLLIADDLYRKFEAATALLGAEHDEPVENVAKHFLTLRDDERARRVHDAVERMRSNSPEALDEWLVERERKRRAEPWIPVSRGPHDPNRVPDGKTIVEVETDANGKPVKAWAQDRPPDPSGVF